MAQPLTDDFLEKLKTSILLKILLLAVSISVGLFAFILPIRKDVPIAREQAEVYAGDFEKLDTRKNYCAVCFSDGAEYELHPHTVPEELLESLEAMEKGTRLFLLIHPNNRYIVEIRTETEELLNFDACQQANYRYNKGYIWIGAFLCLAPVLLLLLLELEKSATKKEAARQKMRKAKAGGEACDVDTPTLRNADDAKKGRILLSASHKGYRIVYRRIRFVNELVVNGRVYDEKKAVVEFPHNLFASIDGHTVEAGYSDDSDSYIRFDGETIAEKKRLI